MQLFKLLLNAVRAHGAATEVVKQVVHLDGERATAGREDTAQPKATVLAAVATTQSGKTHGEAAAISDALGLGKADQLGLR